ncbi:MAG: GGDEF domain-containing protein [Clostridium sp.]|nr:GGDEF domain-containing protein [Clostridium sp.]
MINYYGLTKKEFEEIKPLIQISDQHNMKLISLAACVVLLILSFISHYIPFAHQFKETYIIFAILFCIFNTIVYFIKKYHEVEVYCLIIMLFTISMELTLIIPYQPATIFPIMLMIVPLLFTINFYSISILISICSLVYVVLVLFQKYGSVAKFDIYNISVLLCISMFVRYLIQKNAVKSMRLKIENQKLLDKLYYDANHDALTGMLNRKAFVNKIVGEGESFIKTDYGVLGIIDIDNFKYINDTFGHLQGDEIIRKISSILRDSLYENDVLCRLGGDEFVFCLLKRQNSEDVNSDMEKILKSVNEIIISSNTRMGISIGIVDLTSREYSFMEAYKIADDALYKAKHNGRNRFCIAD